MRLVTVLGSCVAACIRDRISGMNHFMLLDSIRKDKDPTSACAGKKIRTMHNETIIEREQAYRVRLKVVDIPGDVELFQMICRLSIPAS